jgi:hypothetical protein
MPLGGEKENDFSTRQMALKIHFLSFANSNYKFNVVAKSLI